MCAFIKSPIGWIAGHQFNLDLGSCLPVVNLVEHGR